MTISQPQKASQLLGHALSTNPTPQNELDSNIERHEGFYLHDLRDPRALVIKIVYNFLQISQKLP